MKIAIFYLVLLTVFATSIFLFANDSEEIKMSLDFARFRYDEKNTYLEIYYLVNYVLKEPAAGSKDIWLEFSLTDMEKDSLVASSSQKLTLTGFDLTGGTQSNVKGSLIKVVLPAGEYMLKMVKLDGMKKQRLDSIKYEFKASEFRRDKIAVSDIELGSNIITRSQNKDGLFYKNTMEVFPNPTRLYGKNNPILFYYIELYNLLNGNIPGDIKIQAIISDTEGQIRAEKSYTRSRGHESLVECGQFNVSRLEDGLYTLIYAVVDSAADYSVYTRSNFYIINPDVVSAAEDDLMKSFSESEFFTLPEKEVDQKFQQVRYLATKKEIDIFERMDTIESKRLYLFKFWREREKQGGVMKEEYYTRVDYANEYYAFSNRKGWESDRGRVYILYGEPDRVTIKPQNPDERPYEVWFYHDIEGGVKFLFVDETGFGDYRLMTSNMRGEVFDPQYDNILRREQ
jgi:GWxTD domain-containing protein